MKKFIAMLLLGTALVAPGAAYARDVTIKTTLTNYSGNNAYLSIYLTKPDGSYETTLWVSGSKVRYLGELRGWVNALQQWGGNLSLDGITGASVGSGRTLTIHAAIADAMIDAGYQIHVESAVEHGGEYPDDAVATVTSTPQTVNGNGYVSTLSVSM
jgi:hypothetical protein